MADNQMIPTRAWASTSTAWTIPDGELLAGYLAGDSSCFVEIVNRHQAMVYGICKRILRSHQDAEDAFQATFIVLARRATEVRPANQLARWLYGVARRTALKLRSQNLNRQFHEARMPDRHFTAETSKDIPEDIWNILDEETSKLPAHLLSPFILCDLEGLTYREAARQLGLAEGTLSNRLSSARKKLAYRLMQRGIVLPATGLSWSLFSSYASSASPKLLTATVEVAVAGTKLTPLASTMIKRFVMKKIATVCIALSVLAITFFGSFSLLNAYWADKNLKPLEGTWTVVKAERSGKEVTPAQRKTMKVTIKMGKLIISVDGREETAEIVNVDNTITPNGIDLRSLKQAKGPIVKGIYELDGNTLKICWDGEPNPDVRTPDFKTSPTRGGRLLVLKKAQP